MATAGQDKQPGKLAALRKSWLGMSEKMGFRLLSDATTLIGLFLAVWALLTDGTVPQAILAVALGLVSLVAVVLVFRLQGLLIRREARQTRKRWHADAMPAFADAAQQVSFAVAAASDREKRKYYLRYADGAVRKMAEAFGIATGKPCRVTLKQGYAPPDDQAAGVADWDAVVRTVSASAPSGFVPKPGHIDWVRDNTDFQDLARGDAQVFFCNDLPKEVGRGYVNSHWDRDLLRSGKYPYRSTVVWPVKGVFVDEPNSGFEPILGFLCVDSAVEDTFDEALDVPTGRALAHAFYSLLVVLRTAQEAEAKQQATSQPGGADAARGVLGGIDGAQGAPGEPQGPQGLREQGEAGRADGQGHVGAALRVPQGRPIRRG